MDSKEYSKNLKGCMNLRLRQERLAWPLNYLKESRKLRVEK